jgi:hypothetical protein
MECKERRHRPPGCPSFETSEEYFVPAQIMDGTSVAESLLADTKRKAQRFADRTGRRPVLATVLVGGDPPRRPT